MKKRVLVVDDDRLVADTLKMVFAANGYESDARYSALDGIERARSFAPGLVLCDVTMPGESGLHLAECVHEEMPQCKVLMLSAYASNEEKVRLEAIRSKRPLKLLTKPCRPEDLLREVDALLMTA